MDMCRCTQVKSSDLHSFIIKSEFSFDLLL